MSGSRGRGEKARSAERQLAGAAVGITKSALVIADSFSNRKGNFFFSFLPDMC